MLRREKSRLSSLAMRSDGIIMDGDDDLLVEFKILIPASRWPKACFKLPRISSRYKNNEQAIMIMSAD